MLDDLKYIHQKDEQDALGIAEKQGQQLEHDFAVHWERGAKVENIVFAGMGGSALAALLSTTWPSYDLPFEIIRNYTIPAYVGSSTLFIA
jgi:glucose/mannose-6-phosphate isomerase